MVYVNYDGTYVYDTVIEGYDDVEQMEACTDDKPEMELDETFGYWE